MANGIYFEYSFGFPHSTPVVRSYEPFKTIKKEYLIISWMSLLGNVGGTLGMFIGFSFITTSELAIDAGLSLWKNSKLANFFEWCIEGKRANSHGQEAWHTIFIKNAIPKYKFAENTYL